MSRKRLICAIRRNDDFKALTRHIRDLGLQWELVKRNSKGHPELHVTGEAELEAFHTIAGTPIGYQNCKARVAELRRTLKRAGFTVGD